MEKQITRTIKSDDGEVQIIAELILSISVIIRIMEMANTKANWLETQEKLLAYDAPHLEIRRFIIGVGAFPTTHQDRFMFAYGYLGDWTKFKENYLCNPCFYQL